MFWVAVSLIALGWLLAVIAAIVFRSPWVDHEPVMDELAARRARKENPDVADPPAVDPGSGAPDGTEGA